MRHWTPWRSCAHNRDFGNWQLQCIHSSTDNLCVLQSSDNPMPCDLNWQPCVCYVQVTTPSCVNSTDNLCVLRWSDNLAGSHSPCSNGIMQLCIQQKKLPWETTAMRDYLSWNTQHFGAEGPTFPYNWTCHQIASVLTDHIFVANGVVLQETFYCIMTLHTPFTTENDNSCQTSINAS